MNISDWTIAIIFVKEWWNNTLQAFFSSCTVIWFLRGRTVSLLSLRYQHKAPYLKGSVYIVLALKSTRKQNIFMEISFWRASLSFSSFVSYLNQISLGWSLRTIPGHLKCLLYTKWLIPGDIPCPPSLLSFFEPAILHVGSTNLREEYITGVANIFYIRYLYLNKRPNLWKYTFIISFAPSFETCYDIENLIFNVDSMFLLELFL